MLQSEKVLSCNSIQAFLSFTDLIEWTLKIRKPFAVEIAFNRLFRFGTLALSKLRKVWFERLVHIFGSGVQTTGNIYYMNID
jgi:hypothetical protein